MGVGSLLSFTFWVLNLIGENMGFELLKSNNIKFLEGLWKPKNDAKSEFYPGFLSKIQNSRV